jgi:hypothetical protein
MDTAVINWNLNVYMLSVQQKFASVSTEITVQ